VNTTSQSLICLIIGSDSTLTAEEKNALTSILPSAQTRFDEHENAVGDVGIVSFENKEERPIVLTQQQVAVMLGVHRVTVYDWKELGYLQTVELAPGTIRYHRSDVEEFARTGYRRRTSSAKSLKLAS
jgi:predicted DNA-binding transcriptional regulator AlpA